MPEYQKIYNKEIGRAMRFPHSGYPSAFIYDGEGRLLGSISGYRPAEKYMQTLRDILEGRAPKRRTGSLTPPPAWLRQSPEELIPMLERKKQAAARAAEAGEKAKKEVSFEIIAWGLEKGKVDRPFDPEREIRLPVKQDVFFKVRYRVPETPKSMILMQMFTTAGRSPYLSGSGEYVFKLRGWRACSQNKIFFMLRLQMEESLFFRAAEQPCRIIWE